MSKFVITQRHNGEFRFNLKANNGQVILASEGYNSKSSCEKGIASVKANALDRSRYDKKVSRNGKYYFNLKATNGQVIGSSEMYESAGGRNNGIESVMKNAPLALMEELTG